MSNIYIQEPPTNGKILLVTSVGDIDIELWSKEAPKACRNIVQLCLEGYYDDTIFHRMVPDFIVQGGDPTGTGDGGESIYGQPFRDEFHSRLRFVRRGLVAMANAGRHDNGSQFFLTLGQTPELQDKHTIFGKVVGDTLYNMLKLGEGETDGNDRPLFPHKIIKTKVLHNPFDDIVPRVTSKKKKADDGSKKKKQSQSKATKNFNLLSFGEEAEEDEQETDLISQNLKQKGKSSHDLLDDAKLSAVPVTADSEHAALLSSPHSQQGASSPAPPSPSNKRESSTHLNSDRDDSEPSSKKSRLEQDTPQQKSRKEQLKDEVRALKKDLAAAKKRLKQHPQESSATKPTEETKDSETLAEYKADRHKYEVRKAQMGPGRGDERQSSTLAMLAKFQERLFSAKKTGEEDVRFGDDDGEIEEDDDTAPTDSLWLAHKLEFDTKTTTVKDANVNDVNRYEIYDPRNPINKRRRETDKKKSKR